jgi:DNA modification methylase
VVDVDNPIKKEVIIGDCRLILGDCLSVMPTLGKVDAVVTDPPYGINYSGQKESIKRNGTKGRWRVYHEEKGWDKKPPDFALFEQMLELSSEQIIWGGNYFADRLPVSRGWLVWYKAQTGLSMSDCELAWTSLDIVLRMKTMHRTHLWKDRPQHPTQKPVALMEWCLGFLPDANIILDPFTGSGTTLVACAKLGRSGIGIELDEDYFNIACERVEKAYQQADLFVAPPENKDIKRNQVSMFDDGDAA